MEPGRINNLFRAIFHANVYGANRQHPLYAVRNEHMDAGGRRFIIELNVEPLNPLLPVPEQVADRAAAIAHLARDQLGDLQAQNPNWTLSIVMELDGNTHMLDRPFDRNVNPLALLAEAAEQHRLANIIRPGSRSPFGVHRRFQSQQAVDEDLAPAIVRAIENMVQSARNVQLEEVVFTLMFDLPLENPARGRIKGYIRKSINRAGPTPGLAAYTSVDGLCGYQAVVLALSRNPHYQDTWVGPCFFTSVLGEGYRLPNLTQSNKLFRQLAEALQLYLDQDDWLVTAGPGSTAARFVQLQPAYQIAIFNETTRQLVEWRRGVAYDDRKHTILLSWTLGHVHLIKSPFPYFGKAHGCNYFYCHDCLQFKTGPHECRYALQCDKCFLPFLSEDALAAHQETDRTVRCTHCQKPFYNDACMGVHRCTRRDTRLCELCQRVWSEDHVCSQRRCMYCKVTVEQDHRCFFKPPKEPQALAPEVAGEHYYAFDLESMLVPVDDYYDHVVNLVVVRRCFSGQEWIFATLAEFVLWLEALQEPSVLFAHNLKGYDGRLIFEHLFSRHTPPQNMMWRGCKIMSMEYGKVTFRDTLLHLPASLEELPAMFGLDPDQFKKGFFPYRFNIPEHQAYVGHFPDMAYFDPHMMRPKKKQAFLQWYEEQRHTLYDFHKELVEYCVSDVRILAKAIEAYMSIQMAMRPLNPFDSITIASYALNMYHTFYMPEDTIVRLTSQEHDDIARAMHGGRTDTRCLLREWTPEEVANGYYGKYQDVQSLYPTVQFYDPMPVGAPRYRVWQTQPSEAQLKEVFGFVCCDIEPTRYLHHPILVELDPDTGRLVADLQPKTNVVIPTPELHLAMANGYKVTRVYWWYDFDQSTDLFKSYFQDVLKIKIEASGKPKWIRTPEQWDAFRDYHHQELGISLHEHQMIPNPSRKAGAKLLANSLWGKFGERSNYSQWKTYGMDTETDQIMRLENLWMDGVVDIQFRKYSGDLSHVAIIYKDNRTLPSNHPLQKLRRSRTNIAIAAMVTSHARCRLWTELNKLGDRVLYHDTDSIIYEHQPDAYNIPEGKYLGEWECETGGRPITAFTSTGPKCYSYMTLMEDGSHKACTKVKGISLNAENAARIHFDSMKSLVVDDDDKILAQCLMFQYDRNKGTMITKTAIKEFKKTYAKGFIDTHTWRVYPFGWERFTQSIPRSIRAPTQDPDHDAC